MSFSFTERLKIKPVAGSALASLSFVFHSPAIIHDEWHKQIFNRHKSNLKGELGIRGDPGRVPSVPIINVRVVVLVVGGLHVILSEPQPLWLCQFVSAFYTRTLWKQFFSAAPGNHRDSQQHPGNQHKPLDPMLVSVVHQLLCGVQLQWTVWALCRSLISGTNNRL